MQPTSRPCHRALIASTLWALAVGAVGSMPLSPGPAHEAVRPAACAEEESPIRRGHPTTQKCPGADSALCFSDCWRACPAQCDECGIPWKRQPLRRSCIRHCARSCAIDCGCGWGELFDSSRNREGEAHAHPMEGG
jgi:hypothetical protein